MRSRKEMKCGVSVENCRRKAGQDEYLGSIKSPFPTRDV